MQMLNGVMMKPADYRAKYELLLIANPPSTKAKDMVYFHKFVSGLDASAVAGPSELATDKQGARDLSYNPEHHNKTKHVARRHFFIRDMVEKMELRVPLVSTVNNYADFFTKPLKAKAFFALRDKIMNVVA